jgi:hypothetical protein
MSKHYSFAILTKFVIHQIIIRFNSVKCKVIRFQCYRYRSIYCFVCLLRKSLYYASGSRNCPSWNNMPYQFPLFFQYCCHLPGCVSLIWCALMMIRGGSFKTNSSLDTYNGVTCVSLPMAYALRAFLKLRYF